MIVSDRDPKFTSAFWRHFFRKVEIKLTFSTTFHPQIDGQTERVNGILNQYLRNFVSLDKRDWADYVDFAGLVTIRPRTQQPRSCLSRWPMEWEPLQPADLTLERALSTLEFNQDGEDLAQSVSKSWRRPSCCWRRPKSTIKSKSMPEDMKLSMGWAKRCY